MKHKFLITTLLIVKETADESAELLEGSYASAFTS